MLFGSQENAPEPEETEERVIVPTFTPTPEGFVDESAPGEAAAESPPAEVPEVAQAPQATATPLPPEAEPVVEEPAEPDPTATPEPPTATPTPAAPNLTIGIAAANLRNGPGTNYGLAGAANEGQQFEVVGRNADGTWWQICCVNGQQAWIFANLVTAQNVDAVPVAQNIPAPPPVVQEPEPEPQPEPEQQEPEPAPPPQSQAVHAGPCSQCKFRISGGPTMQENGGLELKIQADFIHSGVDGGQRQGDYRIGLEKDGQLIGHFSNVLSIRLTHSDGPMGPFNYEASVGSSDLPGGTIAGRYFFWVIDGNRIRDSEVWTMDLSENQGFVWIQFDQN